MGSGLGELVGRWASEAGLGPRRVPDGPSIAKAFRGLPSPCRPAASPAAIQAWEERHGFALPRGLRVWLGLSNGFYAPGPLIHPLEAIGPMVPFARVPELVIQPESWFELGNPNVETVCVDLGYRRPAGGHSIFTSGDDQTGSLPRVIASDFDDWFLGLLRNGGREYWFDRGFEGLGHPWDAHLAHAPAPPLPARLRPFLRRTVSLMIPGADDRSIASTLGLSRADVEALFRHIQHARRLNLNGR